MLCTSVTIFVYIGIILPTTSSSVLGCIAFKVIFAIKLFSLVVSSKCLIVTILIIHYIL